MLPLLRCEWVATSNPFSSGVFNSAFLAGSRNNEDHNPSQPYMLVVTLCWRSGVGPGGSKTRSLPNCILILRFSRKDNEAFHDELGKVIFYYKSDTVNNGREAAIRGAEKVMLLAWDECKEGKRKTKKKNFKKCGMRFMPHPASEGANATSSILRNKWLYIDGAEA